MATDFPLFPSLPQELQDHIWSLAVRPLPGTHHVHSFYLADHYVDKATVSDEYQADFLHFTTGRPGWSLGVPREGNRSAYALDTGLWHACRQSRKALLNHFRSNKYWAAPLDEFQPSPSAEIDVKNDKPSSISPNTHTGVYIDSNNKKQYITIFPQTDLVHILDPVDQEWFHHYAGDYAPVFDAPECRWGATDLGPGFVGRNVAVDFEPSWAVDFEPRWRVEIPGEVEDMIDVLYTEAVRTVWFIDSRLKRKTQDGGVGSTHGMVFYGWGYRLVEVKREEMGLWEMDTPGKTAFDFFDRLEGDSNGRLEVDDPERLRVLAYQSI